MSLPITITNAGLAELVAAAGSGTDAITIAAVGVSATEVTPEATMTGELPGELYRFTSLSGSIVSPDTIHLVMEDSSANAYTANSFALYLADGTLFAVYGQSTPIYTKTAASIGMLAIDITFASALATSITFGNANFINPPASTTTMGVVQLATLAQAEAGTDLTDVLTPATALAALPTWLAPILATYATLAALGSYVTTVALDAALAGYATLADLGAYATTAAMDAALSAYATLADLGAYATIAAMDAALSAYATLADLGSYATTAAMDAALRAYAPLNSPALTGEPTTPAAAANDDSGQIANTGWVWSNIQALVTNCIAAVATASGFSYSFGASGYVRLPSWLAGFIIQWASVSVASGYNVTTTAVTFPIAFPTACRGVVATQTSPAEGSAWRELVCGTLSQSITGFTLQAGTANPDQSISTGVTANYIAIGN